MSRVESVVDKSVRDFRMRGSRAGDVITIVMNRQKYVLSAADFDKKTAWEQAEVLQKMYAHWDDEPGGPDQAQRIRDGFRNIVRKLMTPSPSLQDLVDASMQQKRRA